VRPAPRERARQSTSALLIGVALSAALLAFGDPTLATAISTASGQQSGGQAVTQAWRRAQPPTDEGAQEDANQVRIDAPTEGQHVGGMLEIRGRATTPDPEEFDYYRVYVGRGRSVAQLRPLGPPGTEPVEDGILATIDLSLANPGEGLIVVRVFGKGGETYETNVAVIVDATPLTPAPVTGPIIIVPTVAPPEPPPVIPVLVPVPVPVDAPVAPAPVPIVIPEAPSQELPPIPQVGPGVTDTLPSDPVQPNPLTDGIEVSPPVPTPVPLVPIPQP
jgi:hypothetical protein